MLISEAEKEKGARSSTPTPTTSKTKQKGMVIRPNIKISVFQVTCLKSLGREGTHNFCIFFLAKRYNFNAF